jgi:FkbM family methyltransferase
MLKRIAKRLAFEIQRLPTRVSERVFSCVSDRYKYRHGVIDLASSVQNLRQNGFRPGTVIDVGAYHGEWTRTLNKIYPDSRFLMVEANPDKEPVLAAVSADLGGRATYRMALLGAASATSVPYYLMGTGSSVLPETTSLPRSVIYRDMTTLDEVAESARFPAPYLLKLDVQGYELEILRGAGRVLKDTEAVLLEVALIEYNEGAPLFAEVIAFMQARGFVAYDLAGFYRRESDDALFMLDILFVLEHSALRVRKPFWNIEVMQHSSREPHAASDPAGRVRAR